MRLWRTRRGRRRLARHYLPLGGLTAVGTTALAIWVDSPSLVYRLSIATAFAGLALFGVALAIGPASVLARGRPPAVSTDLRRDIGILAAMMGLAHVVVGLMVYPDIRLYFVYPLREWPQYVPAHPPGRSGGRQLHGPGSRRTAGHPAGDLGRLGPAALRRAPLERRCSSFPTGHLH